MRAFIVRPFGVQQDIDFDRVQAELIEKALARLRQLGTDIDGGTTGVISSAGNIREDMFRLLAVSDLVIADVTIHNANAFYELGVRHALCPGSTQLIRARNSLFKYPFDLQTDRYFQYDLENLAGDIEELAQALRGTLAKRHDSPIFLMLDDLTAHGRGKLVKVPNEFREDVQKARDARQFGELRLLAHESRAFEWDQEGLALVGEAQFDLRAYRGAKETFEKLRRAAPDHFQANWRLGTLDQRISLATTDPLERQRLATASEQAIQRALQAADTAAQKAELKGLLGSNAKTRWMEEFMPIADPEQRARAALESPCLQKMLDCYLAATALDLNEHYPAINALTFLKIQTQLAQRFPDIWEGQHPDNPEMERKQREILAERLIANLRLSLRLDEVLRPFQPTPNDWTRSSVAYLMLLSEPNRKQVIAQCFRDASDDAERFKLEASRRNLHIFRHLGLFEPGVSAALAVIDAQLSKTSPPEPQLKLAMLFTGHRIDAPGLPPEKARFPSTPEAEALARRLIFDAVKRELATDPPDKVVGIAGGASGADILFHEVCAELGIRTELLLALPMPEFQTSSVKDAGEKWVTRYQALCATHPPRVLQESREPPAWLAGSADFDLWERNNLWLMFSTLAIGAERQTLIAFYNQDREANGPGGTGHLLRQAQENGLRTVTVDARPLLET